MKQCNNETMQIFMISVDSCTSLINQYLPEPEAGLLAGILLGARANMDRSLYNALIITGTLHIVALSGANISILSGLISSTLLKLQISRRISGLLSILIIIGFVWFVGPSASVIRAAMMACLVLLSNFSGRSVWPFWSWLVTVCIMLSLSPRLASDISFQLSAGATLGIILYGQQSDYRKQKTEIGKYKDIDFYKMRVLSLFTRLIKFRLPSLNVHIPLSVFRLPSSVLRLIKQDLRLTLAAQVFTIPIILFHFHRISLISPVPNLLIGWILPPLMVAGYVTVVAGLVIQPLGQLLAWLIYFPLAYIIGIIEIFSKIPLANIGY